MKISKYFTKSYSLIYNNIQFVRTNSEIRNLDGSIIFVLKGVEVPLLWSQVACDILSQKYFRKISVPKYLKNVDEAGVPHWLKRKIVDYDKYNIWCYL